MEYLKIRCNSCESIFYEDKLIIENDTEHCPVCNRSDCLMDLPQDIELLQMRKDLEALKKESLQDTFHYLKPYNGKNLSERIDNMLYAFNIESSEDFTALENYQYRAGYIAGLEEAIELISKLLTK